MPGCVYGVGVGPGDPELMTLKAVRILKAADVIACPGKTRKRALHIRSRFGQYRKSLERSGSLCPFR